MNQNTLSPDDPRLTAYALDEMTPAERAAFARLLEQDPAARQAVEEIRATTALLATALEQEPLEPVRPLPAEKPASSKILRFPQFYYLVSGLAAACFALFFVHWQQNQPESAHKKYLEVDLAKMESAKVAKESKAVAVDEKRKEPTAAAPGIAFNLPVAPATAEVVPAEANEVVAPSPLQAGSVAASRAAPAALGGTRGRVELKDTGSAISVTADRFLAEASSARNAETLKYAGSRQGAAVSGVLAKLSAGPATEGYAYRKDGDYLRVADQPVSTFAADVDTASYANVRRFLTQGQRPPADAVRIEELVNYFPYGYAAPTGSVPFAASLEVAAAPWAPDHRLVRIGLKAREVTEAARPPANLVFLLDVSGSMNEPNKLPLVKQSLRLLVEKLRPDDHVAIAVYAGASGLALPSTPAANKAAILDAIERLQAEGSTNGEAGIQLAYDIAKANFVPGGVNRVILATDGDFNVGVTSEGELLRLIQEKAKSGVFLSVLGFGMGNLKDSQLEQLADKGNGNYAYIDSLAEAKKSLVEQAGGTLVTIAKDVKLQVEFNPQVVQAYRLIGYENRLLAREDFNYDKVDAGEIGAGHTVTALYEVVPVGAVMPGDTPAVDALKYQKTPSREPGAAGSGEMLTVKIRYKEPAGDVSTKLEFPLSDSGRPFAEASPDFKFAAAVAAFGQVLRDSPHQGAVTLPEVAVWARAGLGSDAGGYRNEFITLVEQAQGLVR